MANCKHEKWKIVDEEMNKDLFCELSGRLCTMKCENYVQDPSIDQLLAEKLIELSLDSIRSQIDLNRSFSPGCKTAVKEACDRIQKLITED